MSLPVYPDHNVDRAIIAGLRLREVDVLTAMQDRMDTHVDDSIFQRATDLGRVVLTNDTDFLAIADRWQREGRYFPGLIHAR